MSGDLIIPVNGVYFDQIVAGTKREEYRLQTPYWSKRLVARTYRNVVLTRGYPKAGGVEGVTRLTRAFKGYQLQTLTHPHFGPNPVDVFAINVEQPS